jgi:hypothetical protein
MTTTGRRPGRGFALIECLIIATSAAIAIGLVVVSIQSLLMLDTTARRAQDESRALARLAARFRADAHAAARATPPPAEAATPVDRLRFEDAAGGWAEYIATPGALEIRQGRAGAADPTRVETIRLRTAVSPELSVARDPTQARSIARLVWLTPGRPVAPSAEARWRVEATLGAGPVPVPLSEPGAPPENTP